MPAKGSVLVVDDNDDNRDLVAEYLSLDGFDVTTAANGVEAVTRAEQLRPHLVLMDLALPGIIDGWEATRRIKASPTIKDTVVIAMTARAFPHEQQKAMHAGCHAVVTKPLDFTHLAALVETAISRRTDVAS
jgi:two-component system, cell cycle response regulator DivK